METPKVSKHAKRRAAKKAQNQTGTEDKTRDAQIKENEYAPGETKSNEEMIEEQPVKQEKKVVEEQKKGGKSNKNKKLVAPVFADKEIVVVS